VPTTPTAATTPPHLAYTGVDYPLLAMVGAVLVGLGGLLMRRRRVAG
jgi:LPXTG-motif cell wall-anchored protein